VPAADRGAASAQPRWAAVAEEGPAARDPWRTTGAEGGLAPTDPLRAVAAEVASTAPPHRSVMRAGVSRLVHRRRRPPLVGAAGPPPLCPPVRAASEPRPHLHLGCTAPPSPPRRRKASIHRVRGGS
jgi:hypothetical protein